MSDLVVLQNVISPTKELSSNIAYDIMTVLNHGGVTHENHSSCHQVSLRYDQHLVL